jgi:hypothetical protein
MNIDITVIWLLYLYAFILLVLVVSPQRSWLLYPLIFGLIIRTICVGFRINVGSDIGNYTDLLTNCDLNSINSLEFFWAVACLPSNYFSDILTYPFLWIGTADTLLFWFIARKAGYRIAALHDLIYLQTNSMGAIRQALAMKLIILGVIIYAESKYRQKNLSNGLIFATPFIHLAAIIPLMAFKLRYSGFLLKVILIGLSFAALFFISQLVDEALLGKFFIYLSYESTRDTGAMYLSWVKRIFIVLFVLVLTKPKRLYWVVYGIALLFGVAEFYLSEIAVRVGAYFEQFEVLLIGASMKKKFQRMGFIWYGAIGVFYVARFIINISSLPH